MSAARHLALALSVVALSCFSCVDNESDSDHLPRLRVGGSSFFIPAAPNSAMVLEMDAESDNGTPALTSDRGEVRNIRAVAPGKWEAELWSEASPGPVGFSSPNYSVSLEKPIYLAPTASDAPIDFEIGRLDMEIDPANQSVKVSFSPENKIFGAMVGATLIDNYPPVFNGGSVTVPVAVGGDNSLPLDFAKVYLCLDTADYPGLAITSPAGTVQGDGRLVLDYGGFPMGHPEWSIVYPEPGWGNLVEVQATNSEPFTVSGRVIARLPAADNANANFTITPYLTKVGKDRVTVSWETDAESQSFLRYGPTPECRQVAFGETERYTIHKGYDYSFRREINAFFHRVEIRGLEPGKRYYYRVDAVSNPTPARSFKTAPPPGTGFTFAIIGDTQQGHEAHAAVAAGIASHNPDLLAHVGDFVQVSNKREPWLKFFEIESELLSSVPLAGTLGNHDHSYRELYYNRFFTNAEIEPGDDLTMLGSYYSFDYGHVHFTIWDSDVLLLPGSDQLEWLEQDLEKASRDPEIKFIVAMDHKPPVSGYPHGELPSRDTALALYQKYDVDVSLSGHIHLYERSAPRGKVYISSGGGGGLLLEEALSTNRNPDHVTSSKVHNYVIAHVLPESIEFVAYDIGGNVIDQVLLRDQ